MTIDEIKQILTERKETDVAAVIDSVYSKYMDRCYDTMHEKYCWGYISQVEWEAYCYLWKNLSDRKESLLAQDFRL